MVSHSFTSHFFLLSHSRFHRGRSSCPLLHSVSTQSSHVTINDKILSFLKQIILQCMHLHLSFISSPTDIWLDPHPGYCKESCSAQKFGYLCTPQCETAGSWDRSGFNFWTILHTSPHDGFTGWHCHQSFALLSVSPTLAIFCYQLTS